MAEEKTGQDQGESKGEGGSRWREVYRTEDYWAIWLGLAIIAVGLLVFLTRPPEGMNETIQQSNATMAAEADAVPFRTVAWYQANDAKQKLKATGSDLAGIIGKFVGKPHGWKSNPAEAFVVGDYFDGGMGDSSFLCPSAGEVRFGYRGSGDCAIAQGRSLKNRKSPAMPPIP